MTTTLPPRQPRGVPSGGEYAPYAHAEGGVALNPAGDRIPGLIDLTPEAQEILDSIRAAGGRPLIVGGAVRDSLLARAQGAPVASKDVDIEVYGLSADQLRAALPGNVQEFGQNFGVLNTSIKGQDFDVTLPRRDNKTGEGHRGFLVETDPEMPFEEAFARRDFTINAMGWDDATGELVDPFGGRADLEAGVLRHTSAESFGEDPIRVFRGVQFSGRFGFDLDPETAQLCREIAPSFHSLHKDGIWKEFRKLTTKGTHISKALQTLHAAGWEDHFPDLAATRGVPQDPIWHPEGSVEVHLGLAGDEAAAIARRDGLGEDETSILVLAAITHDFGKAHSTIVKTNGSIVSGGHHETGVEPARQFLAQIGAPNDQVRKVLPLIREHMCHTPGGDEKVSDTAVRRLLRRLDHAGGGPSLKEWSRLVEADKAGRGDGARHSFNHLPIWLEKADRLGSESGVGKPILKGPHLAESGIERGPLWGHIIAQSVEAQDDGVFTDEAGARDWLAGNRKAVLTEAQRRWQKAQAKAEKLQRARLAAMKIQQTEQKAQARAEKERARAARQGDAG
ncbi:metal-dependent phosphohydrolase [Pseudarthrobacter sp. BIM B-2242]|uniref:metal-dependent phosphohydrolase n=1 Tax=Pseudarthrobacter sp. BIM B-2242 TaxID=2772401 RepID=UPI00168AF766|nr:metal-dependent phosphohydrolase [Pseudarthrobacter sp. BIM B-2242]QOD06134.1 metal-dependent phosphohydrolase [Pseudarthrobacter sp. BIM B-2242]